MKKIQFISTLFLFISPLFLLGCSEQITQMKKFPYYKTDLEKMKLRGKVKTFREFSYKTIDSFGVISKGEKQYKDGFIFYDNFPPKGGYLTFNIEGFFIENVKYDKDEDIIQRILFTYNDKGKKTEQNIYDIVNKLDYKKVFKYNDKGYLIDRSIYNKTGKLNSKFVFKHDLEYNMITVKYYYPSDELGNIYRYIYNDFGNLIESHNNSYGKHSTRIISYFRYDFQGNLIEENSTHTIEAGSVDIDTSYEYNDKGDVVSKDLTTYEYVYDTHNNWIKRIEYTYGFPEFILEREIKYY